MQIFIEDKNLEYARPIVRRVAKKYRELFVHKAVISGKLHETTLYVSPCLTDAACGFHMMSRGTGQIRSIVQLYIHPDDSPAFVAFLAAHELAHAIFAETLDALQAREIGYAMEESMADTLAFYVLSHSRFPDPEGAYRAYVNQAGYRKTLAPKLARGFGDALEEGSYIDAFLDTTLSIDPADPLYPGLCEELDLDPRELPGSLCVRVRHIHNDFWYYAVLNQFHRIVEIFDDILGEGAYAAFCEDLDLLYGESAAEAAQEEAARLRVEQQLETFLQLRSQERSTRKEIHAQLIDRCVHHEEEIL